MMNFDCDLFSRYWHLACHRRELAVHGDFIRFDSPLGEVVVFNDSGNIVAFDNRCPHRGARIFLADHGNQPFYCEYHGWSFKNGKVLVPEAQSFSSCNVNLAKLKQYSVGWCGDFVFFSVDPMMALYEQLGSVAETLENISFNIDLRSDFNRYQFECYWPLAIENALEPYHINMVHPETLASLQLDKGVNEFFGANSIWCAPVGNIRLKKNLERMSKFLSIDYKYDGYMSIYLFPFSMVSSTYGFSYSIQNFFPGSEDVNFTNFTSRLLTAPVVSEDARQVLKPFFESSAIVNRKVFEEDHSVCKRMPKNSWSFEPLVFFSDSEVKIQHFRDSCHRFMHSV